jgi:molybdopterin converting factor small subunit
MEYLPPGKSRHQRELIVDVDTVPNQVIDQLKIPRKLAHIVLVNGFFICGEDRGIKTLEEGDVLAMWPPVAGG